MVGKIPKDRTDEDYNIPEMKKDIEASIVCSKIVESFNFRIAALKDPNYLEIEFLVPVIYEIDED